MRHEIGSFQGPGVLTPAIPVDIGARSQRQKIVDAMAKGCDEKSFATTTIADIVERASISRATFYKHFENKRQCFDEAVESFIEELASAAVDAQSRADTRPDAIRQAIAAILDRLVAKPIFAKLALIEAPIVEPTIVVRHRERAVEGLESQWGAGKGGIRAGADARISFGRAHVLIVSYLAAGRTRRLPDLLPELTYVALLPFVGHEEALAQASISR